MPPPPRCWAEVDGAALRHNLQLLRGLISAQAKLLAVVKANAYGHGLVPVARELAAAGVDWLGVANVAEGTTLRAAGVRQPILLLSAALPGEIADALQQNLTFTVSQRAEGEAIAHVARALQLPADVHFKIDTGMGRLGSWHAEAQAELAQLRQIPNLKVAGLCTHFASADDDAAKTEAQWKIIQPFFAAHPGLLRHAANSPAVARRYGFEADLVRAGLALYGVPPSPNDPPLDWRPALSWRSRISLLREVGAGRTVSYGGTYRVPKAERHAVVSMGYGDGYFRLHSNQGAMLVRGVRCPIRGRVTMDEIITDVTNAPGCQVGDEVVALGRNGTETIHAWDLAATAQTIPWEILTNISVRVPRIYRNFATLPREDTQPATP